MELVEFPGSIFRRIGWMAVSMRDGINEGKDELEPEAQARLAERLRGYEDAIEDVLAVMRKERL